MKNNGKTCKNCGNKYWDWDSCCSEPLFNKIKMNKPNKPNKQTDQRSLCKYDP